MLCGYRCDSHFRRGYSHSVRDGRQKYGFSFIGDRSDGTNERIGLPREWDDYDYVWQLWHRDSYRFHVELTHQCSGGRSKYRREGEFRYKSLFDILTYGASADIAGIRPKITSRYLATRAMRDLRKRLEEKNFERELYADCDDEMRELYDSLREAAHNKVEERLSMDQAWSDMNNQVELRGAHIRSWLRLVLYDAAETTPEVQALLNGVVQVKSPMRLSGEDDILLWRTVNTAKQQLSELRDALRSPVILEKLRNEYGHAGVMRASYLGIDAPSAKAPESSEEKQ